jgi:DNA alkylation damage repair protein AlkB
VVAGLLLIPSLLPPALQVEMMSRLLHRDLANANHKTNLHLHHDMSLNRSSPTSDGLPPWGRHPYRKSFFGEDPSTNFQPKDSVVHKEISMKRALEKKLRWVTLGGQYDWTAKEYPRERPPPFPADIAGVLRLLFPQVDPQAAILNFYSPQDVLSVHRDVSEECDHGLISLSFGCDAIFVVGNEDGSETAIIRLCSGDALFMSNPSRFAWHGVPKVVAGTCPEWLEQWPMVGKMGSTFEQWKGWMAGKRINLNVRQMSDNSTSAGGQLSPPN